jgi:Co/Zn/Cd efflux system component
MQAQQRQLVFLVSSGAAIILVIIGVLYLAGAIIATGAHDKRAAVCLVLAVVAAVIAVVTRPQPQPAA